ncbi:MAG TPA: adenylate/guanylate cyclase domain-containing protein [Spirochaetes bacterium]|nr:adenylate/guanylate cyclase domain-containing protein [Spirochaetota bacterium]
MDHKQESTIPFRRTISFRVLLIIVIALSIGIGATITYFLYSQNTTIIESREGAIQEESEVLYIAIRNNMLAGEAPIAVDLFQSIRRADFVADIRLYRAGGQPAFSDNTTLETVNGILGRDAFTPKITFLTGPPIINENFKKAVSTVSDVFVRDIQPHSKKLIIYKPLVNQPRCSGCHGVDHVIRGVISISTSVDRAYAMTRRNTWISGGIYGLVVAVLSVLIILFMKKIVIQRILSIGLVVQGVGRGDFKTKVAVTGNDEICRLGDSINEMIDGLNERFKLTRFVSRSTLEHVRSSDEIALGGEKKTMTVLFTDIRGFTSFSEKREPEEVIRVLNEVMNLQSDIVHEFGGDIDKFVGDELMAVFEGDDMVLRALRAAEKIRDTMSAHYGESADAVFVGIGVNTGEMIAGNMGSGSRMDRTVIGDAVNLGSRLCSIAGKNTIVISEYTWREVSSRIDAKEHDAIQVKGKSQPVKIYTLRKTL